jgi:mono/diheme cytochrome c family protein
MRLSERFLRRIISSLFLIFLTGSQALATIHEGGDKVKGEQLFNANCASCHRITDEVLAAPGLGGIDKRWAGKDALLVKWIQNPQAAAASGDPYIKGLVEKYVPTYGWMAAQAVSEADVKDILTYVKEGGAAVAPAAGATALNECETLDEIKERKAAEEENDGFIWFVIVGVILSIIAVSAANISRSLKNAIHEREGQPLEEHTSYWETIKVWMWKNKKFVSVVSLFLFCYFAVVGYRGLMDIGIYEGYTPEQPIWFSHAIHNCQNEIDCNYCHSSAVKSKHAGIPSVNVCMNCHKGIKKGKITGEAEIAKIYAAIGFDPKTGQYIEGYEQKPVQWNKVHNLPDHVYFSHQQHVTVGNIDCKQCHGPVQKYNVGHFATIEEINSQEDVEGLIKLEKQTLTMGWCIECHNKAEIDLTSSDYYTEMHERFKTSEVGQRTLRQILDDGEVSVKEMGGWECGKCHY